MATDAQRVVAIIDAAINRTATAQQRVRIVNALLGLPADEVAQLTDAQKARRFLAGLNRHIRMVVTRYEAEAAEIAARRQVALAVDADIGES